MNKKQRKKLLRIAVGAVLFAGCLFLPFEGWLSLPFFFVPYIILGYDVLRKAGKGVLKGRLCDEYFLMSAATLGAFALSAFGKGECREGVAVMLFYQIGEWFQQFAMSKSRKSFTALADLRPAYARLVRMDGEQEIQNTVSPEDVPPHSVVCVRPGEKVPLDGKIIRGEGYVNTVAFTGESLPRYVKPGDTLLSGFLNEDGTLYLKTEKTFEESSASSILDLMEKAASQKAKAETFINRFAKVYTPSVCALALALGLLPPLFLLLRGMSADFGIWIYRALSFLVISCPCALVVSVPLAFFAGLGGLSKAGVLVKGAEVIETLARSGILCTDKTGTLTEGRFTVVKVLCSSTGNEEDLLTLAAHAEKDATHPIAESIKEAYGKPWSLPCETIRQVSGKGVLAEADGKTVLAGTRSFLTENGVSVPEEKESGTLVYVAAEGKYLGCLVIADTVKKEAKEALSRLASLGVRRTVMLTGDRKEAARPVAEALGISETESELLPQDKLQYVRRLLSEKKKNESLVYVGDGINDAPVLALADVGIAMGALGSDAAMEASDALLMNDSLLGLPRAVSLSRRVMRLVRENVALIIGVKAVCLILTASGVSGMFLAVFADVGVLVVAILNAVRGLFVPKALRK